MANHDYFSDKRRAANPWEGYSSYRVLADGEGKAFSDGCVRFVVFDGEALVGEFFTQRAADVAFLDGERSVGGVRRKDYKGLGGNS